MVDVIEQPGIVQKQVGLGQVTSPGQVSPQPNIQNPISQPSNPRNPTRPVSPYVQPTQPQEVITATPQQINQLAQVTPKKQKIPPVVATLLLISFAVAIGVVVMSFGRAQVELEAVCPIDIGFDFAQINGKADYCFDGTNFKFTLENGININVEGLVVNVIGTDTAQTFELSNAKMTKAGTYLGNVVFSGAIRQVKISPKIFLKGQEEICVEKALIVENIPSC